MEKKCPREFSWENLNEDRLAPVGSSKGKILLGKGEDCKKRNRARGE